MKYGWNMEINYNPSYLFLSRDHEDHVRDIGKHDFRSALLHPALSNADRKNQICLLFGRWKSGYQNKFLCKVRPRAVTEVKLLCIFVKSEGTN